MSNSAASFVDPINAEYREVVKAERAALPHAIKCGEQWENELYYRQQHEALTEAEHWAKHGERNA